MKPKKPLVTLAQRGSLKRFSDCLTSQAHTDEELFDALRVSLLWNQAEKAKRQAEKAKRLLGAGADPHQQNAEGDQLLTHAAIGGNPELVQLMITYGCDPNHSNVNRRTALHSAARSGRVEPIRVLVEQGADIDSRDAHGRTPLIEALSNRHSLAAIELLQYGADINVKAEPLNRTPLMCAASGESPELARLILEKGANPDDQDDGGCTALMHAARAGRLEIVQLLIKAGADLYVEDAQGRDVFQWASAQTPDVSRLLAYLHAWSPEKATEALLSAAREKDVENIKFLLNEGAQIQPKEEGGKSALANAVFSSSTEGLETLLANPAVDTNYRSGKPRRTALCVVPFSGTGSMEKARLLIEAGAKVDVMDIDGMTAIHHAANFGLLELIKLLHRSGADLMVRDAQQRTLLHIAIHGTGAKKQTVQWLLQQGLPLDSKDVAGVTPLMLAAMKADEDLVQFLINEGADINAVDKQGRNALYHAISYGTDNGYNDRYIRPTSKKADPAAPVITTLLASGADPNQCDVVSRANVWRWPGAVAMLKRYAAKG